MVFRNLENPILKSYSKFWILSVYVTHIILTLKLTTEINLLDFSAVAQYREHRLWRADCLNGQVKGRARGSLPSSFFRWETEAQGREGGAGKKGKMQLICSRPPRKTDAEWEHESTFLTPPPFPPLHIQGLHLRAAWEFIRVNSIVCGGYQEEPTSSQMY